MREITAEIKQREVYVDNSFFIFDCLKLGSGKNPDFTFKTDSKDIALIIQKYFKLLQAFCLSNNFEKDFGSTGNPNSHSHRLKPEVKNLVGKVFGQLGKNRDWINQNIVLGDLYQIDYGDNKGRLIMLKEIKGKYLIVKPLLLDPNHMIDRNPARPNILNECLICRKKHKCPSC